MTNINYKLNLYKLRKLINANEDENNPFNRVPVYDDVTFQFI